MQVLKGMGMVPIDGSVHMVEDGLYIGDHRIARDHDALRYLGITHIVNAAREMPDSFPRNFHYHRCQLEDRVSREVLLGALEPSFRYIQNLMSYRPSSGEKPCILVHCYAGMSRSASIVIYYLMRSRRWSFDAAFSYLKARRHIVSPNQWYRKQLKDVERILKDV